MDSKYRPSNRGRQNRTIDATLEHRPFSAEGNDTFSRPFSPESLRPQLMTNDTISIPKQSSYAKKRHLVSEHLRYRSVKRNDTAGGVKITFNASTQPSLNDVFSSEFQITN